MYLFSRPLQLLRSISNPPHVLTGRIYVFNYHLGPSRLRPKRRLVTLLNDNGSVPWNDLSRKEKVVRGARQTFNFGLIVCGATLFGGVMYILYTEVFSPNSQLNSFNTAIDRIKKDPRCIAALGAPIEITAYGESMTSSRWKSRPFVSTSRTDEHGNKRLFMKFNVNGPKNRGIVYLHLVKGPSDFKYSYKYIGLYIDGNPTIVLDDTNTLSVGPSKKLKLFGVTWR